MAITNAKLSDKLDTLAEGILQLVELQTAALEVKSTPVNAPSQNGGRDGSDVQPLLYPYFLSKGSVSRKVVDTINGLLPGEQVVYGRGVKGYINKAFARSSYTNIQNGKDTWNEKTRSRIMTRRTSKSGKTINDGVTFRVTVPKWDAANNDCTIKRLT